MVNRLITKILRGWSKTSNSRYIKFLRKKGVKIGNNCVFHNDLDTVEIDLTRPSLIEIGDNVQFNKNFTLLTHDYVSAIFVNKFQDFIPSSGRVKIGNNVCFGMNCTVLKGVSIGNNCFIGAGSLVIKSIPDNVIAAGSPAKVICTVEEYYEKRKLDCLEEAKEYARSITHRFNRLPSLYDFKEEFRFFFYPNHDYEKDYKQIVKKQLGRYYDIFIINNKPKYNNFDEFLKDCNL